MTSAAFTAILCASSATLIVSGTEIWRMTGSGAAAWVASLSSSPSSWRCLPLLGGFRRRHHRLRRRRLFRRSRRFGAVALDEYAPLADLDLDRPRPAGAVRRLDLGSLLAGQRDLLLLILAAVLLAQIVEQPRLVLLGELVAFLLAGDARLGELLEQDARGHLQVSREFLDRCLGHDLSPAFVQCGLAYWLCSAWFCSASSNQ